MSAHRFPAAMLALVLLAGSADAAPPRRDVVATGDTRADYPSPEELAARIDHIAADPFVAANAAGAIAAARASLLRFGEARRAERESWARATERRIQTIQVTAEAAQLEAERERLQRGNERLQLDLARAEAARVRAELERERLQAQIRAEEAERLQLAAEAARLEGEQAAQAADAARAEARQAKRIANAQARANELARKEAELAAALEGGSAKGAAARTLAVADSLFARGAASITSAGRQEVARLAAAIAAEPATRTLRIEARGPDRELAERRALALRDALVGEGVAKGRVTIDAARADAPRLRVVIGG